MKMELTIYHSKWKDYQDNFHYTLPISISCSTVVDMHHFSTVHYVVSLHKHSFPIITRSNEYIIKWHLEILVFGCTLFYLNGILFNIEWNEAAGTSLLSYLCELAVGSYS